MLAPEQNSAFAQITAVGFLSAFSALQECTAEIQPHCSFSSCIPMVPEGCSLQEQLPTVIISSVKHRRAGHQTTGQQPKPRTKLCSVPIPKQVWGCECSQSKVW